MQKAIAHRDFLLCFSSLLMVPLMAQYFRVMSEMRRLEISDYALKKQAEQANKTVVAMMDENKKLTSTNKKLEELSFKKVTKVASSPAVGDEEDTTAALIRQTAILKK